jgi:uncharacterized protein
MALFCPQGNNHPSLNWGRGCSPSRPEKNAPTLAAAAPIPGARMVFTGCGARAPSRFFGRCCGSRSLPRLCDPGLRDRAMCGHQFRRRANNHVVVLGVVACAASFAFLTPSRAQTLVPRGSERPSFDCSKARTAAARLICADGELAQLDGDLGTAFQDRKAQLSPTDASALVADELTWIRDRNARCDLVGKNDAAIEVLATSKPCLASAIQQRIASLAPSGSALAPMSPPQQQPMALIPLSSSQSSTHPKDMTAGELLNYCKKSEAKDCATYIAGFVEGVSYGRTPVMQALCLPPTISDAQIDVLRQLATVALPLLLRPGSLLDAGMEQLPLP